MLPAHPLAAVEAAAREDRPCPEAVAVVAAGLLLEAVAEGEVAAVLSPLVEAGVAAGAVVAAAHHHLVVGVVVAAAAAAARLGPVEVAVEAVPLQSIAALTAAVLAPALRALRRPRRRGGRGRFQRPIQEPK